MVNVTVIGGGGGIGQALCLLLKLNPNVSQLRVFDLVGAPGVAADLSHIDTPAKVTGHGMSLAQFTGDKKIDNQGAYQADAAVAALTGAQVIVIPAGVPRKPGMTRQDLFGINAGLLKGFAEMIAKNCPKAFVCIVTNPVNSTGTARRNAAQASRSVSTHPAPNPCSTRTTQ
jgi:malate dehydrogenase